MCIRDSDDSPRQGWTRWVAMKGQGEANDPKFNVDGTRIEAKGYVTDLLTDRAVGFMQELSLIHISEPTRPY